MSFNVQVKVDPTQAVAGAQVVGAALAKTEAAGIKAGKETQAAFDKAAASARSAANAFKSVADGIRSQALGAASGALAGLTAQFEREAAILERLRGPMREYQANLRALDMLHRKGMVSASEYASELMRMKAASSSPSAGGFNVGGALAIGGSVMAGAGLARGLINAADEDTQMRNRLTSVADLAGKASLPMEKLYERLRGVSVATRTDLETTVGSFTAMSSATRALGISQERVLAMTENLGKAFKVGGRSSAESAAAMMQLGQALASGRLQGDEFRSMMENATPLMNQLAEALGVTIGKLREMSSAGELTSKVVFEGLEKGAGATTKAFAKTNATIGENLSIAKSELKQFGVAALQFGRDYISPSADVESAMLGHVRNMQAAADAAKQKQLEMNAAVLQSQDANRYAANSHEYLMDVVRRHTAINQDLIRTAHESSNAFIGGSKMFADQAAEISTLNQHMAQLIEFRDILEKQELAGKKPGMASVNVDAMYEADLAKRAEMLNPGYSTIIGMRNQVEGAQNELRRVVEAYKNGTLINGAKISATEYLRAKDQLMGAIDPNYGKGPKGVDYAKKMLDEIKGPARDYNGSVAALDALMSKGAITAAEYARQLEKVKAAYDAIRYAGAIPSATEGFKPGRYDDVFKVGPIPTGGKSFGESAREKFGKIDPKVGVGGAGSPNPWDQAVEQATNASGAMQAAFTNAYAGIENNLVDMITKQKADWAGLVDSILADLARLAIRQAIAGAVSGDWGQVAQGLGTAGLAAGIGAVTRTAQPTSPTIGPADSGGVSARRSGGGGTTIIVQQSPDALLPALERPGGARIIARVAVREAGPALSRRPRYGG